MKILYILDKLSSLTNVSRVKRPRERARYFYNKLANYYQILAGSFEDKYSKMGLRLLNLNPGEHVLEVGFGTGSALVEMSKSIGNKGRVVGIDISDKMVQIASKKLQANTPYSNYKLIRADVLEYEFGGDSFDAIFICFTMELFDNIDIAKLLKVFQKILDDEGRLVVVALNKSDPTTVVTRLYELFHRLFPTYLDCRPLYTRQIMVEFGYSLLKEYIFKEYGLEIVVLKAVC